MSNVSQPAMSSLSRDVSGATNVSNADAVMGYVTITAHPPLSVTDARNNVSFKAILHQLHRADNNVLAAYVGRLSKGTKAHELHKHLLDVGLKGVVCQKLQPKNECNLLLQLLRSPVLLKVVMNFMMSPCGLRLLNFVIGFILIGKPYMALLLKRTLTVWAFLW